jgi:hypothetical protein
MTKRAKWLCGGHSSTEDGIRKPVCWSIIRKLFMTATLVARLNAAMPMNSAKSDRLRL